MDNHTIADAMNREEITEEEAYFILRFAGRMGYDKAIKRFKSPWDNIREWFIWIGGWEYSELSQWDRGKKRWELFADYGTGRRLKDPFPLALFGHRVVFFGWGWKIKCFGGYLCASSEYAEQRPNKLYWSPNGTPWGKGARLFIATSNGRRVFQSSQRDSVGE